MSHKRQLVWDGFPQNFHKTVILRACDFFDLFVVSAYATSCISTPDKIVILRACDFIGCTQKPTLKTKRLGAAK
jgi:hypothetical protein